MFSSNSTPFTMPVTPAYGNGGGFGGFGDNGAWWLIVLIILFGGWGGYGRGGFGGNQGSTSVYEGYVLNNDFSQLSKQISDTYNMTDRKFEGIANGICSLGYDQLAQMNGINTNILTTGNAIQTANLQGFNSLQGAVKDCCCQTQQNIKDTQYVISDKANAVTNTINSGFCQSNFNAQTNARDIIDSQNNGTRAILDKLCSMETERLREKLEAERDAKFALQGQLDRAQLRTQIVDDVRPCPKPAFLTCNPWGCNCQNGYNYGYGTTIA